VTNSVGDLELTSLSRLALLVFLPEEVLVLKVLSEDLGELVGRSSWISSSKTGEVSKDKVSEVINLIESLFQIVGDGKALEPVLEETSGHGRVSCERVLSVLDNLSNRSNSVVTSMVELIQLHLLLLDLAGRSHLDSSLEGLAAILHNWTKVLSSTALGDNSNSIGGSLTEGSVGRGDEATDSLDHELVVSGIKVAWAKVLNNIIQNEESKLLSFGLTRSEGFLEELRSERSDKLVDHGRVGLH